MILLKDLMRNLLLDHHSALRKNCKTRFFAPLLVSLAFFFLVFVSIPLALENFNQKLEAVLKQDYPGLDTASFISELQESIIYQEKNQKLRMAEAILLYNMGEFSQCIISLNKLEKQNEKTLTLGAQALEKDDKPFDAAEWYLKLANLTESPKNIPYLEKYTQLKPKDEKVWMRLASVYMKQDLPGGAADVYSKFLKNVMQSTPQDQEVADLFFRLERWSDAIAAYGILQKKSPRSLEINKRLALAYEQKDFENEALNSWKLAFQIDAKDTVVQSHLISLLKKQGKKNELESVLTQLQSENPDHEYFRFELANLYLSQNLLDRAYTLVKPLSDKPGSTEADKIVLASIVTEAQIKDNLPLLLKHQDTYANQGKKNSAVLQMQLATSQALNGKPADAAQTWMSLYRLTPDSLLHNKNAMLLINNYIKNPEAKSALVYLSSHSIDSVKPDSQLATLWVQSLFTNPGNSPAFNHSDSSASEAVSQKRRALEAFIKSNPQNSQWNFEYAKLLFESKNSSDHKQSLQYLNAWLSIHTDDLDAWSLLAEMYSVDSNQVNERLLAMENQIRLLPAKSKLRDSIQFAYGILAAQAEKHTDAIAALEAQSKNHIKDPDFKELLAKTYLQNGELEKAERVYIQKALKDGVLKEDLKWMYAKALGQAGSDTLSLKLIQELWGTNPGQFVYAGALAKKACAQNRYSEIVQLIGEKTKWDSLSENLGLCLLNALLEVNHKIEAIDLSKKLEQSNSPENGKSMAMAKAYLARVQPEKAKPILEAVLQDGPNEEASYFTGLYFMGKGNCKQAISYFKKSDDTRIESHKYLAKCFEKEGDYQLAAEQLILVYQRNNDSTVLRNLLSLQKEKLHGDKNLSSLKALVEASPKQIQFKEAFASALLAAGDSVTAAIEFEEIIKLENTHTKANLELGIYKARDNQCKQAMPLLQLALNAGLPTANAEKELGYCLLASKNEEAAWELLWKAREQTLHWPKREEDLLELTKKLDKKAKLPKTLIDSRLSTLYSDLQKLDSTNVEANLFLGRKLMQQQKYAEAAHHFQLAAKKDRSDRQLWSELGLSYLEAGRADSAEGALQHALDLGIKDDQTVIGLARSYQAKGWGDVAKSILSTLIEEKPKSHLAIYWYGQLLHKDGKFEEARTQLLEAVQLSPEEQVYKTSLREVETALNQLKK